MKKPNVLELLEEIEHRLAESRHALDMSLKKLEAAQMLVLAMEEQVELAIAKGVVI